MVPPPPPPHHRIRTNNQGEFHGSGLIPRGTPIGKRTHGVTWLSARCSYRGRNPCPWRDPYRGIHKVGRPSKAPPPFVEAAASSTWVSPWVRARVFGTPGLQCVVLPMGFSMGLSTQHWTICPLSYGCPPIKPARELEMSRPPKSTGGRSGRELEMSPR